MEKPIGFLFDLDGVLIDSEGTYTQFWAGVDKKYPTGIPNFAVAIKGTTLPEILKNFPDAKVREEIEQGIVEFQNNMSYELFAHTLPFLNAAREKGVKMAIVTSSDEKKMARLYEQHPSFAENFDVVIDASMVTRSKPDPQGYLKAAAALGIAPENCYVFEDSLQGLKAGRASGAKVIALATTYPRERLEGMGDKVVSSLDELDLDAMLG